ncbi:hypothetical protein [Photorhabdus sp. RM96S]|uniref:hypothetical protein n=1 Tax=Photorhabdus sp. RM96S TaxID=3342822 RepID=UPI0036DABE3F
MAESPVVLIDLCRGCNVGFCSFGVCGFGIGRLALLGMQYGFLSESILREHALISVVVVLLCGLGSLRFSGSFEGSLEDRSVSFPLSKL